MDDLVEISFLYLYKCYFSETCLGGSGGVKSLVPCAFSAMGSFYLVGVK